MLVDRGVFFNKQIPLGNIGFRLIVVVVTDEILHRIVREEVPHFRIELGGKSFIRRHDERREPRSGNDVSHCVGLAAAGHAEQRLSREAVLDTFDELFNCLRLISGCLKGLMQFERGVRESDDFQNSAYLKDSSVAESLERIARSSLRKNPIWSVREKSEMSLGNRQVLPFQCLTAFESVLSCEGRNDSLSSLL